MADPLTEVIQRAIDTYPWDDRGKVTMPDHITAVLSAHLAAVLDAEEARWRRVHDAWPDTPAAEVQAIRGVRRALGVALGARKAADLAHVTEAEQP